MSNIMFNLLEGASPKFYLMRKPEVMAMLGVSLSTLNNWVAKGFFPKPIQLGPRTVAWRSDVVEAYVSAKPMAGGVL
jgi:prophage regulatory protein